MHIKAVSVPRSFFRAKSDFAHPTSKSAAAAHISTAAITAIAAARAATKSANIPPSNAAGAHGASIFVLFGFLLLWLRQPIIRKLLPNA